MKKTEIYPILTLIVLHDTIKVNGLVVQLLIILLFVEMLTFVSIYKVDRRKFGTFINIISYHRLHKLLGLVAKKNLWW